MISSKSGYLSVSTELHYGQGSRKGETLMAQGKVGLALEVVPVIELFVSPIIAVLPSAPPTTQPLPHSHPSCGTQSPFPTPFLKSALPH